MARAKPAGTKTPEHQRARPSGREPLVLGESTAGTQFPSVAARGLPAPPASHPESLSAVRKRAARCTRCPLYAHATQTVFGEGPASARIVLVGEQPGDQEDRVGRPFVGPAGRLLDQALQEAGVARDEVYLTNTVKHFKWKPVGKRRLHQKPNAREIAACRPWLESELALLRPAIVVALGATAAQSLLGRDFRVSRDRGRPIRDSEWADVFVATVHPSSILRGPPEDRARAFAQFVSDLTVVARLARDI